MKGCLFNALVRFAIRLRSAKGGSDTGFVSNARACRRTAKGLNWYQHLGFKWIQCLWNSFLILISAILIDLALHGFAVFCCCSLMELPLWIILNISILMHTAWGTTTKGSLSSTQRNKTPCTQLGPADLKDGSSWCSKPKLNCACRLPRLNGLCRPADLDWFGLIWIDLVYYWLCMIMYDYDWLCMVMYGFVVS